MSASAPFALTSFKMMFTPRRASTPVTTTTIRPSKRTGIACGFKDSVTAYESLAYVRVMRNVSDLVSAKRWAYGGKSSLSLVSVGCGV